MEEEKKTDLAAVNSRKPESSSVLKDQSQTGLGALSLEQMAVKSVHQRPLGTAASQRGSFQSVPINTFSWLSPCGCWDE